MSVFVQEVEGLLKISLKMPLCMWHELHACNMPNKYLGERTMLCFIVKSDSLPSCFSHINMFCHIQGWFSDKKLATGVVFGYCLPAIFIIKPPNKSVDGVLGNCPKTRHRRGKEQAV